MRLLITILLIITVMMSLGCQKESMGAPLPDKEREEVAAKALVTFGKLVNEQNYESMGFESLHEVQTATLGEPLSVFMVGLEDLLEYKARSDPNEMLSGGDHFIYPVEVRDTVRSSIILEKKKEGWEATSYGSPNLARLLTNVREEHHIANKLPLSSYFVVRVPGMNLYFTAYRVDEKLMLIPVLDDLAFKFQAGVTMPASEVFTTIAPAAEAYEDLPR